RLRRDREHLELASGLEIAPVVRHEAIDEAVRLAGAIDGCTADVLDDPEVSVGVRLNALVAAATKDAGEFLGFGRKANGRLPDATGVACLLGEEQPLGPRVPGRPIEHGQWVAENVPDCHDGHAMGDVGVEIDPRDVALASGAGLVALKEE